MKAAEEPSTTIRHEHKRSWTGNTIENLFGTNNESSSIAATDVSKNTSISQMNTLHMFEKLNNTMLLLKEQQNELNEKLDIINATLKYHHNDFNQIKHCITEIICPLVMEISKQVQSKAKGADKQMISSLHNKLADFIMNNANPNNENSSNVINDKPRTRDHTMTNIDHSINNRI